MFNLRGRDTLRCLRVFHAPPHDLLMQLAETVASRNRIGKIDPRIIIVQPGRHLSIQMIWIHTCNAMRGNFWTDVS